MFSTLLRYVKNPKELFSYLREQLWRSDLGRERFPLNILIYTCRILYLVISGFFNNQSIISAMALAYTTLIAVVPILAVMFFIFQAFGGMSKLAERVKPFIFENLAAGSGDQLFDYITRFIRNVHAGTIGMIGVSFLIITAIAVLFSIERVFNGIWGVRRTRSFAQKFTLYWSVLTLGPLFIAISISLTALLQHTAVVQAILSWPYMAKSILMMAPLFMAWIAFFILYYAMPNVTVRLRSAAVGAVVGGSLWELAKWGYAIYASKMVTYSKIYGSLGAIPIFLIWLYLAWIVVLIGAQVAFADQHIETYLLEEEARQFGEAKREWHALRIVAIVCRFFDQQKKPPTVDQLQAELDIPIKLIHDLLYLLEERALVRETTGGEKRRYVPFRNPDQIGVLDVLGAMRGQSPVFSKRKLDQKIIELYDRLEGAREKGSKGLTIKDLIND